MIDLGVKKGSNEKKHVTTIKSLPKELQVEIFAKVATRSISDHCMVRLCCREFLHAAEDDYVYRHFSMKKLPLVPLPWFTGDKESFFLKRCKKSGNPEIAFREGMVLYFTFSKMELGLKILRKAALDGHHEAKYVYCMLLMRGKDEGERKQGFDLFCSFKVSACVTRCRERVKSFVRNMWINNKIEVQNHNSSFCHSQPCDIEKLKKISGRWSPFEDKDFSSTGISCQSCAAEYELSNFCCIIGV